MISEDTLLEFLQEGNQLNTNFIENLNLLSIDPSNEEAIGNAFRALHTLKGNSGFAGLSGTYFLFQHFTDFIRPVFDKKLKLTNDILAKLNQMVPIIKDILLNLNEGKNLKKDEATSILVDLGMDAK